MEGSVIRAFLRAGLVGLVLLLAAPVAGQDFDKGLEAYNRSDYAAALREWRPLAEAGDAKAQYNLALMYDEGQGVPINDAEAVKWYRLAAAQGHAKAQYNLALMYDTGRGVPQDYAAAVKWYRLVAAQGYAKAQYNLALMYGLGQGVPLNNIKAYMWWAIAKAQGNEKAAESLDIVKSQMTAADISEAQRLASEMWEKIND